MYRLSVENQLSALSATFLDIGIGNNLANYFIDPDDTVFIKCRLKIESFKIQNLCEIQET